MSSRFEEPSPETVLLTPELAERVVERFAALQAERQRAEAVERERLASLTRVHELADLLGTTPEEIQRIAEEEAQRLPAETPLSCDAVASKATEESRSNAWLHGLYLSAIATIVITILVGGFAGSRLQSRPYGAQKPDMSFDQPISALSFDPYLQGTVRQLGFTPPWKETHDVLTNAEIEPPPAGFRVKLVFPGGDRLIGGPPGKIQDSPQAVKELRRSIRSLLAFEESLAAIEGALPIVDYNHAPFLQSASGFQGQPSIVGWHVVEVSDGTHTYRSLLPDRRYAKDANAYETAMRQRLEFLTDAKFFPSQPPANLRPNSMKVAAPTLPTGTSIMAWNGQRTVWAQGSARKFKASEVKTGLEKFMQEATRRLAPTMGAEDHLQVLLNVPGGDYNNSWPVAEPKRDDAGGQPSRQASEVRDMTEQIRLGVSPKPPRPQATIYYSPDRS